MNAVLAHQMILANAGSGKTHRLVSRLAQLLLLGFPPRSMAALTFTRKAAGEFQERLFVRLAEACTQDACLQALASDAGVPGLQRENCQAVLRALADDASRLTMGTIDSLCLRIARSFPFECGLPGSFEIADDAEAGALRLQALDEILRARSEAEFEEFAELVREQSEYSAERAVFDALFESSAVLLALYSATQPKVTWGDAEAIWPEGPPFRDAPSLPDACREFREAVYSTHPELSDRARVAMEESLAAVEALREGGALGKKVLEFLENKLVSEARSGSLQFSKEKSGWVALNPEMSAARKNLARAIVRFSIEGSLRRSRALHAFIEHLHEAWQAAARRAGRATFQDITALLAERSGTPDWAAAVGRRMDARFDHWLLDEFQDTSRQQWRVLEPFVDEIIQDDSGRRSFFYVGDVKQAIYSWRGGDAHLFFEIFDHYSHGTAPRIQPVALAASQRSSPVIIEAINQLFGNREAVAEGFGLSEDASSRWQRAWQKHECASRLYSTPGWFCWRSFERGDPDAQQQWILELLERWRPWERGIECACLTAKNDQAAELAALLESQSIPVSLEGKSNPCTDNATGQSLLLALRSAAAPGDSLAVTLLGGFPLGRWLLAEGEGAFREKALRSFAERGFGATLQTWIAKLELPAGSFQARRARQVLEYAQAFERSRAAGEGILEFLDFLNSRQQAAPEMAGTVRIMTVHQSKGLTFHATIVYGLDAKSNNRRGLVLGPDPRHPKWGLWLPPRAVCEQDPVLSRLIEAVENQERLGEVCKAYVALTRARNATVILTHQIKKDSSSKNVAKLLQVAAGGDKFELGNADWLEAFPKASAARAEEVLSRLPTLPGSIRQTPSPARPSSAAPISAAPRPAALGREIHHALASFEWIEQFPPELPPDLSEEARNRLLAFFLTEQARKIFRKPSRPTILHREKPFDFLDNEGRWVSGIVDRLEVHLENGKPCSATTCEFKTGEASDFAFASQLAAYESAVAQILKIEKDKISKKLIYI